MKKIRLLSLELNHFQGLKHFVLDTEDGCNIRINGENASGKTTLFNAATWLLFGKDSRGNEKFAIRPLDEDGNPVHNVDIVVEGTFDIDGTITVLKKTSREKWVKKRGAENPEFQGNEIIYEVDGYPRKEKEYKEVINGIISEDVFRMITNPMYFASLPWKEQRETLMRFVTSETDSEMAIRFGGFEVLLPELDRAPSLEEIRKKFNAAKKALEDRQKEIPVRVDELSRQMSEANLGAILSAREASEKVIADIRLKRLEKENYSRHLTDAATAIRVYEADKVQVARQELDAVNEKIADIRKNISGVELLAEREESEIRYIERELEHLAEERQRQEKWFNEERKPFESKTFDDTKTVCPVCGRKYDAKRIEGIRKAFDEEQKKAMDEYNAFQERQNATYLEFKTKNDNSTAKNSERLVGANKTLHGLKEKIAKLQEQEQKLLDDKAKLNISGPDYYGDKKHEQLVNAYRAVEEKLNAIAIDDGAEAQAMEDIREADRQIAMIDRNKEIQARINELNDELREVSQRAARQEQMIYLLEKFIRMKMESVSGEINRHFDIVNFVLFNTQINGGIKETCEISVDGVPYGSLNNGHRIVAGMDVIKALQTLYGIEAFVFVDNSESVNAYNFPKMDNQMIYLRVTDDSKLRVEVG